MLSLCVVLISSRYECTCRQPLLTPRPYPAERETEETEETDHSKSAGLKHVVKHLVKHVETSKSSDALEHLGSERKSITKCRDHSPVMRKSLRICKSGPGMPLNFFHLSIKPTISMMKTESATLDVGVLRWLLWFAIASVWHCSYLHTCMRTERYIALHCLESNYTALCCRGIPSTFYYTTLQRASLHTSLHYTTIHHTESQTNWSTVQSLACSLPQFYILLQLSALNRRCSCVLRFVASSTLTSHESPLAESILALWFGQRCESNC